MLNLRDPAAPVLMAEAEGLADELLDAEAGAVALDSGLLVPVVDPVLVPLKENFR
jgi:hypothetical protein